MPVKGRFWRQIGPIVYLSAVGMLFYRGPEVGPLKYADLLIVLAASCFIFSYVTIHVPRYVTISLPIFVFFTVVSIVTSPVGITGETVIDVGRYLISFVLFTMTVTYIAKGRLSIQVIRRCFIFSSIPSAIIAISGWSLFQFGFTDPLVVGMMNTATDSRTQPFFYDPNHYASVLTIAYGLTISSVLERVNEEDISGSTLSIVLLGLLGAAVFTTGSRTAILVTIMMTCIAITVTVLQDRSKTILNQIPKNTAFVLILPFLVLMGYVVRNLSDRFEISSVMAALDLKFSLWRAAFEVWIKQPVLGVGPGNFVEVVHKLPPELIPRQTAFPHNTYIGLLAHHGFVGALTGYVLFLTPLLYAIRLIINQRSAWSIGLVCCAAAIGVWAMFLDIFDARRVWFVFGLIVGTMTVSNWHNKRNVGK